MRKLEMYAIGHIALGYLTAKLTNQVTKQNLNILAIWTLSLLPDIDFIIPGLKHRGSTHSIIITLLAFTPFIITKKGKIVPYLATTLTHSLLGDCTTCGGAQLLWPIIYKWIQYPITIHLGTTLETNIELLLFFILIGMLIISKDYKHLIKSKNRNILS